jgi:hypothetical protein
MSREYKTTPGLFYVASLPYAKLQGADGYCVGWYVLRRDNLEFGYVSTSTCAKKKDSVY